jgi:signal transduction histidine kinase
MLDRMPCLRSKLVGVLADRIRETTRADQQREKLMALGRLSAGMAHELNNPASAVRSAALSLEEALNTLRTAGMRLDERELPPDDRIFLTQIEGNWLKEHPSSALDPIERSDREETIADWLSAHQVSKAQQLAPDLVEAGFGLETLQRLSGRFDDRTLPDVVTRLTASFTVGHLVKQIESGSSRIADLVHAIS